MSEGLHSHETGLAHLALAHCYSILIVNDSIAPATRDCQNFFNVLAKKKKKKKKKKEKKEKKKKN